MYDDNVYKILIHAVRYDVGDMFGMMRHPPSYMRSLVDYAVITETYYGVLAHLITSVHSGTLDKINVAISYHPLMSVNVTS